jgi:hypothetical protein
MSRSFYGAVRRSFGPHSGELTDHILCASPRWCLQDVESSSWTEFWPIVGKSGFKELSQSTARIATKVTRGWANKESRAWTVSVLHNGFWWRFTAQKLPSRTGMGSWPRHDLKDSQSLASTQEISRLACEENRSIGAAFLTFRVRTWHASQHLEPRS